MNPLDKAIAAGNAQIRAEDKRIEGLRGLRKAELEFDPAAYNLVVVLVADTLRPDLSAQPVHAWRDPNGLWHWMNPWRPSRSKSGSWSDFIQTITEDGLGPTAFCRGRGTLTDLI